MKLKRLSKKVFLSIYKKVPRLCVDLIIRSNKGVLLSKRDIVPYKDYWHLPGGSVLLHETLEVAAKRIAKEETGLDIKIGRTLGVMEFHNVPPEIHAVSIGIETFPIGGKLRGSFQAKSLTFFKKTPQPLIMAHKIFLKQHKLIK